MYIKLKLSTCINKYFYILYHNLLIILIAQSYEKYFFFVFEHNGKKVRCHMPLHDVYYTHMHKSGMDYT